MGRRKKVTVLERIGYILELIIVIPLSWLIALIPMNAITGFSRALGWLLFQLDARDKKWADMNLDIIFKDNPPTKAQREAIVREVFRNVARLAVEYLKVGKVTAENYAKYAEFVNFEALDKALEKKKGVLVVTLHMGNWEWMGSIPAKLGYDLAVIINRQFNPYTDKWMKNIREKKGKIKSFYNEISEMKSIYRHLKNNGVVALLADQTYYFKPIMVPFFGIACGTADGPAKMHLKFGAPIVMCHSILEKDGRYRFIFEEPMMFEATDNPDADYQRIMTWINGRYETYIREHPEQWFSLLHGRWERTKIEDFAEPDFDPW